MRDLQIRVFAPQSGVYRVEARLDESARFDGEAMFNIDALREQDNDPTKYGLLLHDALFASVRLERAYMKAAAGGQVRLRLLLDPPEISELRWERLRLEIDDENLPAATSPRTPLSRYIEQEEPPSAAPDVPTILLAVANPADLRTLAPIDVEGEVDNLLDAWEGLLQEGSLRLMILPGRTGLSAQTRARIDAFGGGCQVIAGATTLEVLSAHLSTADGLHLIAHGNLDSQRQAVLVLEKEDGATALVEEDVLRVKFQQPKLRFAFLQSCKSSGGNVFGLGPKLVESGVPAVIAMQDFVPMGDARRFASAFYSTLIREGAADIAANNGRQAILRAKSPNWSIPVLFCRLKDAQIWKPDPVRTAIRKLAQKYQSLSNVRRPFPLYGVLARNGLGALQHGIENVLGPKLSLLEGSFEALKEKPKPFVVLLGHRGRAKSTHLQCLFVQGSSRSLDDSGPMPLPLCLADCVPAQASPAATIAQAVARAFQQNDVTVDGLHTSRLADELEKRPFLLLVDGDDDIGVANRFDAIQVLMGFQNSVGPEHQIFLTMDEATFNPVHYPDTAVVFVIQAMTPDRVSSYLESLDPPISAALVPQLRATALFDLAGVPWLLSRLIEHARQGVRIQSRTGVLQRFVREGLGQLGGPAGAQSCAEEAISQMAWRMQWNRQRSLTGAEAYVILDEARGKREFSLDEFLHGILQTRLLVRSGADGVRFAYPGLQSYYCAKYLSQMTERERARCLEDITATLGRLSRVRWWEDTLVALAGLTHQAGQPSQPDALLRKILAGSGLTEGEQIFVATRCLHEARCAGRDTLGEVGQDVVDQIIDTLLWRSRPENVQSTSLRRRAIEALAMLREKRVIPHLVSLAIHHVRRDWEGKLAYDYSSVRQAAVQALLNMQEETLSYVRADPKLSRHDSIQKLIDAWLRLDVATLSTLLETDDPGVAPVAAFALGTIKTDDCLKLLVNRYRAFTTESKRGDILWAITDTLSLLDPVKVTQHAILPLLDQPLWATYLAYLIGRLGIASYDSEECKFLRRCLRSDDRRLQGRALRSYAALLALQGEEASSTRDLDELRGLCHELVQGKFLAASKRQLIHVTYPLGKAERSQLQYQGLEALRSIGNETSIDVLRDVQRRYEAPKGARGKQKFDVNRLSFEIAEEIYWRLTGGLSAETYLPLGSRPQPIKTTE
jgi:HEAT repeat protein